MMLFTLDGKVSIQRFSPLYPKYSDTHFDMVPGPIFMCLETSAMVCPFTTHSTIIALSFKLYLGSLLYLFLMMLKGQILLVPKLSAIRIFDSRNSLYFLFIS